MKLRVLARLIAIQRALARHGLIDFARGTGVHGRLRLIEAVSPWLWFQSRHGGTRGARLREALVELGPVFVKFGQAISTRRDLLPADVADELVLLQDRVPPFDGQVARRLAEEALGVPLASAFSSFDTTPLAAASIAQVHAATLVDGREVIVKILRPGMRELIARDIEVLYALARFAARHSTEAARLRPVDVVREYERTILDELDLMREAANAAHLKRNFAGDPRLHVPEVYWDLCRDNVMVMERIHGIPIGDIDRLRALGVDFRRLSENGVAIFFTQVFRHNFFHADMHPGNIFVIADDPAEPRYAAVDFGIVGTLDTRDQEYLAQNFLAVFDRDYRRVAVLHVESGWVPHDIRVEEMESAIRTICEPIFDRPLKDISFSVVLLRLFEALRRFDARIQPQLLLLQKTMFNIEGLGRQLYPDLDIWKTASPILREWMREKHHPVNVARRLWKQMPELLTALENSPLAVRQTVMEAARPRPSASAFAADAHRGSVVRQDPPARSAARSPVAAALVLLAGVVWLSAGTQPQWIGWSLAAAGAAWLLRQLWKD
ncbi:MAG TPA: ubiquinone biosynthesis regulatory protein kinase UbiB [Steroidobacteraceae bacterium]|nr:ubiquinone biosynthesis regulatory protein kinase UbiB [Steroidobacteraceae bacterium]